MNISRRQTPIRLCKEEGKSYCLGTADDDEEPEHFGDDVFDQSKPPARVIATSRLAKSQTWHGEKLSNLELPLRALESTLIESKKDEDEAKAEEKDAPETKEVNASRQEVLLNSKQKKSENKRRKKPSKSAAMKEDVPNHFKFDYKGKQLINTMDLLRMKMTTRMVMEVGCKSAIMEVGFKGAIMEVNCKPVMVCIVWY
ncbi:hypothetical protein Tco_0368521 [Tanacetum coccineum]